jgi:circadian clock protein KaiC
MSTPSRRRGTRRGRKRDAAGASVPAELAPTGVAGLDAILAGGLPRGNAYVVQGDPGAGKTTLALQFSLAGARAGERTLYVTTSESEDEIRDAARSHGWSTADMRVHYLDVRDLLCGDETLQSVFHPVELELPKTIETLLARIAEASPRRLVIDSLSELRLLAADPRWFRRQVLALKDELRGRRCTTLLCDHRLEPGEPVLSIVHGVIDLDQVAQDYGPDRRRIRVSKIRGRSFATGYHDLRIRTGGLEVYPRLPPDGPPASHRPRVLPSGLLELDRLLGGGIDEGTSTLLLGPAGTGKSLVAAQIALASAGRGQRSALYLFDEGLPTLLKRTSGLGMDLRGPLAAGLVEVRPMTPAEITPGELADEVRRAVLERDVRMIAIDSLAGYLQAVGDDRLLSIHLHELIRFLARQKVAFLLLMAQHGLPGSPAETPIDLSYMSDTVVLLRHFEFGGEVRKAISVHKRRGGSHEASIRELKIGPRGLRVGESLSQFHGILTGVPRYTGGILPTVRPQEEGQEA